MRIVVVGYGAAGMTAADYARVYNRKAEVIVFEKRRYAIYHPCSLPDAIGGLVRSLDLLKEEPPKMPRFEVHTSHIVEEIDISNKKIIARSLRDGKKVETEYDKLVLATGSRPFIPKSINVENDKAVFVLRYVEDAEAIMRAMERYRRAIVVGGSFIGIEVAHALRRRGVDVTLIEYYNQLMPGKLDPDMAARIQTALEEEGVKVVLGKGVNEVSGAEGNKKVIAGGEEYRGDFVVMATGVIPDVSLAREAGLKVGERGGIAVDSHMRTSEPDIYAAGDNVEVLDIVTGKPILSLLGNTAVKMGRVAGINSAGGDVEFKGVVNVWAVNIERLQLGGAGLTFEMAKKEGLNVAAVTVTAPERHPMYSGAGELTVKLVFEREGGRIVGGQVVGPVGILSRLNLLALALAKRMTVRELAEVETVYTPSLCEVIDPLHVAADAALRRLERA